MGPLREWRLGIFAGVWVHVDFGQPVGISAVPMRHVELVSELWLGLGAGNGRVQSLVVWRRLFWAEHRDWSWRLSTAIASPSAASSVWRCRADCCEPAAVSGDWQPAGARQERSGDDRRTFGGPDASVEFAPSIRSFGFGLCEPHGCDQWHSCDQRRRSAKDRAGARGVADFKRRKGGHFFRSKEFRRQPTPHVRTSHIKRIFGEPRICPERRRL